MLSVYIFLKFVLSWKLKKIQKKMELSTDPAQSKCFFDEITVLESHLYSCHSVMSKTLEYVRAFSRFSNIESVREVRQ